MFKLFSFFAVVFLAACYGISHFIGEDGFIGSIITEYPVTFLSIYFIAVSHLTITAMSLSFHRYHTHKGVVINKWVDMPMQIWLWMVTSLSKVDWVSVHIWHHAHSDQEKDPHSPLK